MLIRLLLGLTVFAGVLAAQDDPPPLFGPPPTTEGGKGADDLRRDEGTKQPQEEGRGEASPYAARIAALKAFPRTDGYEAARRLALAGGDAAEALRAALKDADWRVRAGAAFTLGELRDSGAFTLIEAAAAEVGNRIAIDTYFEAMVKIDPVAGTAAVLPHLASKSKRIARQAYDALPRRIDARFRDRIRGLMDTRRDVERQRAFDLYLRVMGEPDHDLLLKSLGDRSPRLAKRAAEELANEIDEARVLSALRRLAREGTFRAASYAMLALVLAEDTTNRTLLEESEAFIDRALAFTRVRGDLENCCGAIVVANLAMRSKDPRILKAANGPVMFRLLDGAFGGRVFRDYSSVVELCVAKAKMLSGEDFGRDASAWKTWWMSKADSFRARRELQAITPAESGRLRLEWRRFDGAGGGEAWTLFGPEAEGGEFSLRSLVLDEAEARDLAARLSADDFFRLRGDVDDPQWEGERHDLEIYLDRARYRRLHLGACPEDLRGVVSHLEELIKRQRWQLFVPAGEERSARLRALRGELAALDPEARLQRQAELALAAFPEAGASGRRAAVTELSATPIAWREKNRKSLLGLLAAPRVAIPGDEDLVMFLASLSGDEVTARVLEFLPLYSGAGLRTAGEFLARRPASQSDARRTHADAEIRAAVIRGDSCRLSAASEEGARLDAEAKAKILRGFAAALSDQARPVRSEAERALMATAEARQDFIPDLLERLDGDAPSAWEPAARILGRLGADDEIAQLDDDERWRKAAPALRAALLRGLAASESERARSAFARRMIAAQDEELRTTGLSAMAERSAEYRRQSFRDIFEGMKDPASRVAFVRAAPRGLGGETAAIFRELIDDDEETIRREAAFVLADRGEAKAVPVLIKILLDPAWTTPAQESLELITCVDVAAARPEEIAAAYDSWWAKAQGRSPDVWFAEALERRKYNAVDFAPWIRGERKDPRSLALLLTVLRDPTWFLRVRASRYLAGVRGSDFVVLSRTSDEAALERARKLWTAWYRDSVSDR
jgi:HEAT repeat protein